MKNRVPAPKKKERILYDHQVLALEICDTFRVDDYRMKGAIMRICGKYRDNLQFVRKAFADTREMAPTYPPAYFLKLVNKV